MLYHLFFPIFEFSDKFKALEPDDLFSIIWNIIMNIILIMNLFFIPLELGFSNGINKYKINYIWFKLTFETIPFIVFIIDIFITINTSYFSNGILQSKKLNILWNYITEPLFLIDLLTLIPYIISEIYQYPYLKLFCLLRLFKLIHLNRQIEDNLQISEKNGHFLELLKLICIIIYVNHICVCIWHLIGSWEISVGKYDSWLVSYNLIDSNNIEKYFTGIHLSVLTMITAGNIETNSKLEKYVNIFIVLFLAAIFAYSIGKIGIILQEMSKDEYGIRYKLITLFT